jgi:sulfopyruvate decarboxylase TPP-binding subunit
VTMRGQWGEFVSWQMPTAKNTPKMLQLYDVLVQEADRIEEVAEIVEAAGRTAFDGPNAVAVLISQRVIGSKKFTR